MRKSCFWTFFWISFFGNFIRWDVCIVLKEYLVTLTVFSLRKSTLCGAFGHTQNLSMLVWPGRLWATTCWQQSVEVTTSLTSRAATLVLIFDPLVLLIQINTQRPQVSDIALLTTALLQYPMQNCLYSHRINARRHCQLLDRGKGLLTALHFLTLSNPELTPTQGHAGLTSHFYEFSTH